MRLRRPCEHGQYDPHGPMVGRGDTITVYDFSDCPGGEFLADDAQTLDLITRAVGDVMGYEQKIARRVLDALAVREGEE